MSLFTKWQEIGTDFTDKASYDAYWSEYFEKEKNVYSKILASKETKISGSVSKLSSYYNITDLEMVGFLDGINESLENALDLESIEAETEINIDINYEKLLFNMYKAKANWLYELPEWNDILDNETRTRIKKEYQKSGTVRKEKEIGRNEPCPCGSGKKHKKCCMNK